MNETWKDIAGYEGLYQVSNKGNVRGIDRKNSRGTCVKGKILKVKVNRFGYSEVTLSKQGTTKTLKVHRIVAFAFVKNPNEIKMTQVNHKDENKLNNTAENLEWCDAKYNVNYGTGHARGIAQIDQCKKSAHTDWKKIIENRYKAVIQKTKDGIEINRFKSAGHASEQLNINQWNIGSCCRGKQKTAGGYAWEYA